MKIFNSIKGYRFAYSISNCGTLYSRKTNKILKPSKNNAGYFKIALYKKGVKTYFDIHRLVAIAFIPNPENKRTVNHKNGIKTDNRVENLEWATYSENAKHSYDILNRKKSRGQKGNFGAKHNRSKFFYIKYMNGDIVIYESALDFMRKTGFQHSNISNSRKAINTKNLISYTFKLGKMKGLELSLNGHFQTS